MRLDKFLAAPDRLASRARAVAALERGKVFLNGEEAGVADAGDAAVAAGDRVRVWMDRPGSARARPRPQQVGDVTIVYEDEALLVVNKPPGLLAVPLERKAERAVGLRADSRITSARPASASRSSCTGSIATRRGSSSSPRRSRRSRR